MLDTDLPISNVVLGFLEKTAKIRGPIRVKKPRSAAQRMKARMRYRKNKFKIKIWRRRYNMRTKHMQRARRLLRRVRPKFFKTMGKHFRPKKPKKMSLHHLFHKVFKTHKTTFHLPRPHAHKSPTFKIHVPKFKVHKPTFHPKFG